MTWNHGPHFVLSPLHMPATMRRRRVLSCLLLSGLQLGGNAFIIQIQPTATRCCSAVTCWDSPSTSTAATTELDSKTIVKLFGRLAEKYIMLDESGGVCCYSGCSDCEYRLPGGGYRMAEQTASRPKWIPTYDSRSMLGKVHTSKWRTQLFQDDRVLSKDQFVERLKALDYAPTLGGPYLAASAAVLDDDDDDDASNRLYEIISKGKPLSVIRMNHRLKKIAGGEEGISWKAFEAAMTATEST